MGGTKNKGAPRTLTKAKGKKAKKNPAPSGLDKIEKKQQEIFVCDICNVFEGTYMVVAKHEKTCKKPAKPIAVDEPPSLECAPVREKKRSGPMTSAERRQQAKKRKSEAIARMLEGDAAELESLHEGAGGAAPAAAVASGVRDGAPLTKAERRKAIKKRKKEALRAEKAAAAGESIRSVEDEDEAAAGARKRPRVDAAAAAARAPKGPAPAAAAGEVRLGKGVSIVELHVGTGPMVQDRKRCKVRYIGRLGTASGAVFDQGTISFRLGRGEVIAGWDIGVQGMREGGKRRITVPPEAGYGRQATGKIPANSTLCFDVTVLK